MASDHIKIGGNLAMASKEKRKGKDGVCECMSTAAPSY